MSSQPNSLGPLPAGVLPPTLMCKFNSHLPGNRIHPPIHLIRNDTLAWFSSILHRDPDGDYEFKITFPQHSILHGCYATVKMKAEHAQPDQVKAYEEWREKLDKAKSKEMVNPMKAVLDPRFGLSGLVIYENELTLCAVYTVEIHAEDKVAGRWGRRMVVDLGQASYNGIIWVPKAMHETAVAGEMEARKTRVVHFLESWEKTCKSMRLCKVKAVIYDCGHELDESLQPDLLETLKQKQLGNLPGDWNAQLQEYEEMGFERVLMEEAAKEGKLRRAIQLDVLKPEEKLYKTVKELKEAKEKREQQRAAKKAKMNNGTSVIEEPEEADVSKTTALSKGLERIMIVEGEPVKRDDRCDLLTDVLIVHVRHLAQGMGHIIRFRVDIDGERDVIFEGQILTPHRSGTFTKLEVEDSVEEKNP